MYEIHKYFSNVKFVKNKVLHLYAINVIPNIIFLVSLILVRKGYYNVNVDSEFI